MRSRLWTRSRVPRRNLSRLRVRDGYDLVLHALILATLALVPWASACGANEGLWVPERRRDAGVDSAVPDGSAPSPREPCVDVDRSTGTGSIDVEFVAALGRTDLAIVIDSTSSMGFVLDALRTSFRSHVVPEVASVLPDAAFAVVAFGDFPVAPFGEVGRSYPFRIWSRVETEPRFARGGLDAITSAGGGDEPESGVEALYQLATGHGLGRWIAASQACEHGFDGAVCFRPDAAPVVVFVTDAPQYQGVDGLLRYPSAPFAPEVPHDLGDAVRELNRIGARLLAIDAGYGAARADLEALAHDVHPADGGASGIVLRLDRDETKTSPSVVSAIRELAATIVQTIDLVVVDPAPNDDVDVTSFVSRVVAVEASPVTGVDRVETDRFVHVRPGTRIRFRLELAIPSALPSREPSLWALDVVARADGRGHMDRRRVLVSIPGADGSGRCETRFP